MQIQQRKGVRNMELLKKLGSKLYQILYSNLLIILFLVLWQLIPSLGLAKKAYISTPLDVAESIFNLVQNGGLKVHLLISLRRILSGLGIAIIFAVPLGLFIGRFTWLEALLDPILQLFRQISALALFPVFILFLGIGETSKVAIIFWASLWPILINTISGVKGVDSLYIKSVLTMGATKAMVFTKIILPASVPSILTGIRLGSAYAVMVLVAAEMIGANSGLGFLVTNSQETFKIPQMYGAIVLLSVLGITLNFIIFSVEKRLVNWRQSEA
jgi:NitT/TauT family transport system permease protein